MLNIRLLMGAPAGPEGTSSQGGNIVQIGMIVAVFAVFWLLIIRPQRKKQKESKNMLAAIKKGDQVTSIGGIRGTVKNVSENTVIIEVDNKGSTLEFTKSAIGSMDNAAPAPAEGAKKAKAVKENNAEELSDHE